MTKFDIPMFPDYELIDFGYSEMIVNKTTGKVLKLNLNNKGRLCAMLFKDNKLYRLMIYTIKHWCYYGYNPLLRGHNSPLTLDHKDGDKTNNHIKNIQVLTRAENSRKRLKKW